MSPTAHPRLVSFIWSIADDCLRDIYNRGKYRDVILPMVVLRRLDALLEPTKDAVLAEAENQKKAGFFELDAAGLEAASTYNFYNTSKLSLERIVATATNSQQQLENNVLEYLNGFSPNIQEITNKFALRRQVTHMASKNVLLEVLEKFTSPFINLTPEVRVDPDGRKLPKLTNLGMGYVFEELIRKFNEENNEEAGEHFTPREVIQLMTHLIFDPVKANLPKVVSIYDCACGSGGMLSESENHIRDKDGLNLSEKDHTVFLFGKEINDETYALCKSDMIIKGKDPENIRNGSTLSTDEFQGQTFDYMLSNPPYGKSWSSEQKYIKDGKDVVDPRFQVELIDYYGELNTEDATPRSSDGQLLFLMEMVSKMKPYGATPTGSRIASVHNGSSLFTGSAGGGESNIRRYLIENDFVEAIIQLPNNLFYNTGISTYVWLLSNRKAKYRYGKVQLIDASRLFTKLRKNLGKKNCELTPKHITQILDAYNALATIEPPTPEPGKEVPPETIASLVFDNQDFGYFSVNIERPERLKAQFTPERIESLRFDSRKQRECEYLFENYGTQLYTGLNADLKRDATTHFEKEQAGLSKKDLAKLFKPEEWKARKALMEVAKMLMDTIGQDVYMDFNAFAKTVNEELKTRKIKLSASEKKTILNTMSEYDAQAEKVIKRIVKLKGEKLKDTLRRYRCSEAELSNYGLYPTDVPGQFIEYETSSDLRDSENVPLNYVPSLRDATKELARQSQNANLILPYYLSEVAPHVPEAWINGDSIKIGYEISFNKHFYRHTPLRSLEEVTADILALEEESEGLIKELLSATA